MWQFLAPASNLHGNYDPNAVARRGLEFGVVAEQRNAREPGRHEEIKLEV